MSKTIWFINQYASTPDYGYAGRHYYLGKSLADQGHSICLITSAGHHLLRKFPDINGQYRIESEGHFHTFWINMPKYSEAHSKIRAIGWFLFPWRMRRLARFIPGTPDVIVCSSPSLISFLGARKLAKKYGARLVFEVRDIWPLTLTEIGGFGPGHPFIRLMQWVEDKAYRESELIVSNLRNSIEHIVTRGGDPGKFRWIPNGFSLDEVSQRVGLNSHAVSQLPEAGFIVGYTGAIGTANALDVLIEAADRLRDYPEIAFVLVGAGKEKASLQKLVAKKGLDSVFFVDPIPKVEVQSMLSRFDACFLGLSKDPLFSFGVSPNKLFDYLYSAKPIIYAIDSGDYRPVEEEGAGIQIPPQDPKRLSDAILKLYQMPETERNQMGDNGRRAALDHYEYSRLAHKYEEVLFGGRQS